MSSYENLFTEFPCLGRRALFDEWPVAVPPSEMRIWSGNTEITDKVHYEYWYFPAAQEQPIRGARSSPAERYDERDYDNPAHVEFTADGALDVPANMGCTFFVRGTQCPDLTARFVFDYPQQIQVETLGSQTFTISFLYRRRRMLRHLSSLSSQMSGRYGGRHDKFRALHSERADYVWLNYPPTPVSAYAREQKVRCRTSSCPPAAPTG